MLTVVDEQIDIKVTKNCELLAILKQRLGTLEFGIALLITIFDLLQRALLRHRLFNIDIIFIY